MTVEDIKLPLFGFFAASEIFDLNKDFNSVVVLSLDKELDKEIVKVALKEFETQGIITKLSLASREVWVLNKPLNQYSQTVELHYATLNSIVQLINGYCQNTGDEQNKVNPLNVTEKDIQSCILLASAIAKSE